ncbi:MAG: Gfo/Idh/MocA family protein [Fusicatenibacter sp.]
MEQNRKMIHWGILGAGAILNRWIMGAWQEKDMDITAVASRNPESAKAAACKFQIPKAMSYGELLSQPDIDVVYVAVPHTAHKELALQAMRAGKHVLVEKPAAVNAAEFEEMTACAREHNVFLMEAVWTRFFPLSYALQKCLVQGQIGQIQALHSAFSFRQKAYAGSGRLFDPWRAGGGLLDVGVYNLHFADMVLNKEPLRITGLASFDTDELHLAVDELATYIAQYDKGVLAVMTSGIRTEMPDTAYIYGTDGYLVIPHFWKPTQMQLISGSKVYQTELPVEQHVNAIKDEGFQYEIRHVNECIRSGLSESPIMPWKKTLSVLRQCDTLRQEWNFTYPFEQA